MFSPRRNRHHSWLIGLCAGLAWALPAQADSLGFWGRVVDGDTGAPVAGIALRSPAGRVLVTTDGEGYFWLPRRPEGLRVSRPGYRDVVVQPGAPGLSTRRNEPDAVGRIRLRDSGELLALVPIRRPLPTSFLRLGWSPDVMREGFAGSGGSRFDLDAGRLAAAQLLGRAALGPVLVEGGTAGRAYTVPSGGWADPYRRWQQDVTVGALCSLDLGERFQAAVGPSLLGSHTAVLSPPGGRRADDYLAASQTRWGIGGIGEVAYALPVTTPLALEARLGLWPIAGSLGSGPASRVQGQWHWQGGLGLRWMPWTHLGLELRYQAQGWHSNGWQASIFEQLSHGLSLGTVVAF